MPLLKKATGKLECPKTERKSRQAVFGKLSHVAQLRKHLTCRDKSTLLALSGFKEPSDERRICLQG